jgi:signal transduction histidine kinase
MADNLEHEMRTPLAGVAASLKNLAGELGNAPVKVREYLDWAERDIQRMEGLLTAIREATTLEQALQQDVMETFSLDKALVMWLEHGWQQSFTDMEFIYRPPARDIVVTGDPHRLRQALDNIVENAVSFHDTDTAVELVLQQSGKSATIQVINQGPVIEPALQQQIFNSMVTNRPTRDSVPHLGLGLFIARTILHYHSGTLAVKNLADGRSGVVFTLTLPVQE